MNNINYLQVLPGGHCLRCHNDVPEIRMHWKQCLQMETSACSDLCDPKWRSCNPANEKVSKLDDWKKIKSELHEIMEPHLDEYFPKTNYDDPSKPSEGRRDAAMCLYSLLLNSFLEYLNTKQINAKEEQARLILQEIEKLPFKTLDIEDTRQECKDIITRITGVK